MVRCRYSDSVRIQVSGPTSLIPVPKMESGRLSMTWLHFLNGICGLQLELDSDFFICTSTYSSVSDVGWTASLNDPISDFISKFTRKRNKYCVRIHTGSRHSANSSSSSVASPLAPLAPPPSSAAVGYETINATDSWMPSILKRTAVKKFAGVVPLTPAQVASAAQEISIPCSPTSPVTPLPSVSIPTQGSQLTFQAIISSQQQHQQQLLNRNNAESSPQGNRTSSRNKRPYVTSDKAIREFTLRVGGGGEVAAAAGSSPDENGSGPPKLSRFDDTEQVARVNNGRREPQPGPSTALPTTSSSTSKRRRHEVRSRSSRFEEDDMVPRIKSVRGGAGANLVSMKLEPIEIDLEEFEPANNDDQAGNGASGHVSEQEICNVLGIHDDEDDEDEEDGEYGDEDEDDCASVCTAASIEERELRDSGIHVQDIKGRIDRGLALVSNSMLQGIRKEIRKLKKNGNWNRNVRRMPLACYMLTELFKDRA